MKVREFLGLVFRVWGRCAECGKIGPIHHYLDVELCDQHWEEARSWASES